MRIISGKHKSRRINAPKNLPTRPTTDIAKEALFNVLNNNYYFEDISVLDLFAGIGSISLEFASRGTQLITSVDQHYGCVKFINATAAALDLNIHVVKSDVFKFLEISNLKTDIIFADPPYNFNDDQFLSIANTIFEKSMLLDDGLLIIEHSKQTDLSNHPNYRHSKKYGGSVFSFFEN